MKYNENFICNKFGYCYYSLPFDKYTNALIYNLYVYPKFRKKGKATRLIQLVINEIRYAGYTGSINIEAKPRENSIKNNDLINFYTKMGLNILNYKDKPGV